MGELSMKFTWRFLQLCAHYPLDVFKSGRF